MTKKKLLNVDNITELIPDEGIGVIDIQSFLAKNNKRKYNLTKAAEEFIELADVCLKMANKKPELHPPVQDLIDEIGDASMRLRILTESEGISNYAIVQRQITKANAYLGYLKEGKYNKGI